MNQENPETPKDNDDYVAPKFRVNPQVFQIMALVLVALAIPITLVVLGLLEMQRERKKSPPIDNLPELASEVPGLRESLESIAEKALPVPEIHAEITRFLFQYRDSDSKERIRSSILQVLSSSGVSALGSVDSERERWIVTCEEGEEATLKRALEELLLSNSMARPLSATGQAAAAREPKPLILNMPSHQAGIYEVILEPEK